MQKYRLLFSYLSTALIYMAIFGIIFYRPSSLLIAKKQSKEKKIALSLSSFVSKSVAPPKEIIIKKPKAKQEEDN